MKLATSQRRWLIAAVICILLAGTVALLIDQLLARYNPTWEVNRHNADVALSERSRATLTDTAGYISIICLLPAEAPVTMPVGQLLRRFEHTSRELSGATLEISYIDPRTEPHTTAQLMASGAHGIGILVRQSGRNIFIPESALVSEAGVYDAAEAEEAIAAAFSRLSREDGIQVGWLTGHGEADYQSTDPQNGLSGLRRALENDGCTLRSLSLNTNGVISEIPPEIKVIAIMNPRYPITTAERALLSDWLDRGGRLICFLPAGDNAGLTTLFEQWGLRIGEMPRLGTSLTAAGTTLSSLLDATHPVTHDLAGKASVTFSAPKAIYPFDVRGIKGTPLVQLPVHSVPNDRSTSSKEVAAVIHAVERGSLVGADLGFRPGRMVLFGEAAFAQNDRILNHASANRDLIVNAVRWLTGHAGSGARGPSHVMIIGQDLQFWRTLFLVLGGLIPLLFCLLIKVLTWKMA